jgi:hypothetical protein
VVDFHLDSDVSLRLVPLLQNAGHTVATARDPAHASATDDAQFLAAVQNGRLLVTHNRRDFALLHGAWRTWPAAFGLALPTHPGILALDHGPPGRICEAIEEILASTAPSTRSNEMFWWRARGGWDRRTVGTGWVALR